MHHPWAVWCSLSLNMFASQHLQHLMHVFSQMSYLDVSRGSLEARVPQRGKLLCSLANISILSLSCRSAACLKIRSGKRSIIGSRLTGLAAHSRCTTLDANNESLWSLCNYLSDPPPPNTRRCSWNPWWGPVAPLHGYRAEAPRQWQTLPWSQRTYSTVEYTRTRTW